MGETTVRYRTFVADNARWEGFAFRPGDIVISTPPKCGTTWTQRMCALLILQSTDLYRPLGVISPWLDMLTRPLDAVLADLEGQSHRRFIKSHTPLDGLPFDERVTYICVGRDPRDVALSFANHMTNLDTEAFFEARAATAGLDDLAELMPNGLPVIPASEEERFWGWVNDPTPPTQGASNLWSTLHHLGSFLSATDRGNVVMLHYADLQADLEGQMRALARRLEIEVPEGLWPELVQAATFDEMRRRADQMAPDTNERLWRDNREFFRKGTSGQWRSFLDADGLERYRARVQEYASPELSDWVHHAPLGAAGA